jgi:hypothetical protein
MSVQGIMPTVGTSQRAARRRPEDSRENDDARDNAEHASLSPPPPGSGGLVDKAV